MLISQYYKKSTAKPHYNVTIVISEIGKIAIFIKVRKFRDLKMMTSLINSIITTFFKLSSGTFIPMAFIYLYTTKTVFLLRV